LAGNRLINFNAGVISPVEEKKIIGLTMAERFRSYLPIVVDVETGGFNSQTDALLEISAAILEMDENGNIKPSEILFHHVIPFEGANIEKSALEFTGIDPYHPFRAAISEKEAITDIFTKIRQAIKNQHCSRALLVGHNATFDHGFVNAASDRCGLKRNPFHPFTTLDTASLAALAFGQTVLAKACVAADIEFDQNEAHSALYDVEKTAELFCLIVNRWHELGGWGYR